MFDEKKKDESPSEQMKRVNLSREQIEQLIPHRGLMLLLDGASIYGDKDNPMILGNYNVFQTSQLVEGHFPGRPIFPGFLVMEALAQAGSVLYSYLHPEVKGKEFFLSSAEDLRFRHPVFPNQPLFLEAEVDRVITIAGRLTIRFKVEAYVMGSEDGKRIKAAGGKLSGIVLIPEAENLQKLDITHSPS